MNQEQKDSILHNVEYHLLKERGVIRYKGDRYYNKNKDEVSEEAEWTFGLSWLAIIYLYANKNMRNLWKCPFTLPKKILFT